jgi:[acyl-carrier-protein] S-malonyltransferase
MGRQWHAASAAARRIFQQADSLLGDSLGLPLTELCFFGPAERLNRTDASQPAIYAVSVACAAALQERGELESATSGAQTLAGLSLGEYTALHLAGAFSFEDGLRLVARRGALMQQAAETTHGGMVALTGADEDQAEEVCRRARGDGVLVCANFNAPGQIVLSGSAEACARVIPVAGELGLRATPLTVAGAFHSPLMRPAADRLGEVLSAIPLRPLKGAVWSNVTAQPHLQDDPELLRRRLVEQIVSPVRWAQSCATLAGSGLTGFRELAPGTVLRGLMRRIDRSVEVKNHDQADQQDQPASSGSRDQRN